MIDGKTNKNDNEKESLNENSTGYLLISERVSMHYCDKATSAD